MKKKVLSLLTALCLMLSLVPAAFAADTSGLQDAINGATNGVVDLNADYTIAETVAISDGVTINGNGHTITYNGTGSAFRVTAQGAVVMNNLTINAKSGGAYGVDLTSSQPDLTLDGVTLNVHTRGVNMYPAGGCTNGKLTIKNSSILNSQKTDYVNDTTVGDTRGIALFDVKSSIITMENSSIKGFGYSINTSNNLDNGIRAAGNTYNITNSNIWGWSAFNIWTVGNTFNLTKCDLRGINPLNIIGNSFSVIQLNNGIYGSDPTSVAPNIFNIAGGSIDAKTTTNTTMVEETVACIEQEFQSEFHFVKIKKDAVDMTCNRAFTAIICDATGTTDVDAEFAAWAASDKLTGPENATYNQGGDKSTNGLIAPGINATVVKPLVATVMLEELDLAAPHHIGGMGA